MRRLPMKTKMILLGILMGFSNWTYANETIDAPEAKQKLDSANSTLQEMYETGELTFNNQQAEIDFNRAMLDLHRVSTFIGQIENAPKTENLDTIIDEAIAVQKALTSYLGTSTFHGYQLKQGTLSNVGNSRSFRKVARRLPFLDISAEIIEAHTSEEIVTQFNSLKVEFYSLLVRAAHYSKTDSRVKNLALWGNETEIVSDKQPFGEQIITNRQFRNLNLR